MTDVLICTHNIKSSTNTVVCTLCSNGHSLVTHWAIAWNILFMPRWWTFQILVLLIPETWGLIHISYFIAAHKKHEKRHSLYNTGGWSWGLNSFSQLLLLCNTSQNGPMTLLTPSCHLSSARRGAVDYTTLQSTYVGMVLFYVNLEYFRFLIINPFDLL